MQALSLFDQYEDKPFTSFGSRVAHLVWAIPHTLIGESSMSDSRVETFPTFLIL